MKHPIREQHPALTPAMNPKGTKTSMPTKVSASPTKSPGQSKPKAFRDSKY